MITDSMLGPYSPDLPDVHTEFNWEADFSSNSILTIQNMAFYGTFEDVRITSITYSVGFGMYELYINEYGPVCAISHQIVM